VPIEEKKLDKVYDLKCKNFLKLMKIGKFYSYTELSNLILISSLHRPQLKNSSEDSLRVLLDMAYIESVIQSQYAVGNLRAGEKDGERYFSKV
jgi:hypothetical protein